MRTARTIPYIYGQDDSNCAFNALFVDRIASECVLVSVFRRKRMSVSAGWQLHFGRNVIPFRPKEEWENVSMTLSCCATLCCLGGVLVVRGSDIL